MNRKERRAANKQAPAGARNAAGDLFAQGLQHERERQLDAAARAYKRLLQLQPTHAEASNNLGRVLQAQGKTHEASAQYAHALTLMPQLFDQFAGILGTLVALRPLLGEALRKAVTAWPQRLGIADLLDKDGFAAVAGDPLLLCLLEATPVQDVALERLLTMMRAALLTQAANDSSITDETLHFLCALARQCFINEYVFATTPDEDARVAALQAKQTSEITPAQFAALAAYVPLGTLASAQELLTRKWPPALEAVLTQQIREPAQERALSAAMPRLTVIEDDTSQRVRQQYEENPYPRWVHIAGGTDPVAIDDYLRSLFPTSPFTPLGKTEDLEVLVAGCGTGFQAAGVAQKFLGAQLLAVDLSLASLGYAKRNTPARLASRIDYAQADILKLGALGRAFDVVEASGVLHHMADPFAGWRVLASLVSDGGLMHIGLYSEAARRDVVAARAFIAERGYGSTPQEIRRCRQELIETPLRSLARYGDFFSTSECRDLLFHVQEARLTIPAIKRFLAAQGLRFLGFEFDTGTQQRLHTLFRQSGWAFTDLDRWDALEAADPMLFAGMYQFWVQKR